MLLHFLLVAFVPAFGPFHSGPLPTHDIHLSHTRIVVDGTKLRARIRLFQDDLELVLRRHTRRPDLTAAHRPSLDSAFASYLREKVALTSAGERLSSRITASGPDPQPADSPMWVFDVELSAERPISALTLRFELMFEQFDDQRNIVIVVREGGAQRQSLYFAPGGSREQTVTF
jgi:hypothetical protein